MDEDHRGRLPRFQDLERRKASSASHQQSQQHHPQSQTQPHPSQSQPQPQPQPQPPQQQPATQLSHPDHNPRPLHPPVRPYSRPDLIYPPSTVPLPPTTLPPQTFHIQPLDPPSHHSPPQTFSQPIPPLPTLDRDRIPQRRHQTQSLESPIIKHKKLHREVEQHRRMRMAGQIDELRKWVCNPNGGKTDKVSVLIDAVTFVKDSTRKIDQLEQALQRSQAECNRLRHLLAAASPSLASSAAMPPPHLPAPVHAAQVSSPPALPSPPVPHAVRAPEDLRPRSRYVSPYHAAALQDVARTQGVLGGTLPRPTFAAPAPLPGRPGPSRPSSAHEFATSASAGGQRIAAGRVTSYYAAARATGQELGSGEQRVAAADLGLRAGGQVLGTGGAGFGPGGQLLVSSGQVLVSREQGLTSTRPGLGSLEQRSGSQGQPIGPRGLDELESQTGQFRGGELPRIPGRDKERRRVDK